MPPLDYTYSKAIATNVKFYLRFVVCLDGHQGQANNVDL